MFNVQRNFSKKVRIFKKGIKNILKKCSQKGSMFKKCSKNHLKMFNVQENNVQNFLWS